MARAIVLSGTELATMRTPLQPLARTARRLPLRPALSVLLALQLGACSWLGVQPPPEHHQELDRIECTDGNAFPILDAFFAVGYALTGIGLLAVQATKANDESKADATLVAGSLLSLGWSGVLVGSSVNGFSDTKACRRAKLRASERLTERRIWSAPQPPAPQPPARNYARPQPVPQAPASRLAGCQYDTQCKGDRICVDGECVGQAAPAPAGATTPAVDPPARPTAPAPAAGPVSSAGSADAPAPTDPRE